MANRLLPGVYSSLQDLSNLPEGQTSLTVGVVLKANKGKVNTPTLVTSPTTFLSEYFFGNPKITDDPTTWSIIKILGNTNQLYVSRAANNPLYGGVVVRKSAELNYVTKFNQANKTITLVGDESNTLKQGDKILVRFFGIFTVVSATKNDNNTDVVVEEDVDVTKTTAFTITKAENKTFTVTGAQSTMDIGAFVSVGGSSVEANNKTYTVVKVSPADEGANTTIEVAEDVAEATDGTLYTEYSKVVMSPIYPLATAITDPENYNFQKDDLFLLIGSSQGGWNNSISFEIESSLDDPSMIYAKGNKISTDTYCTFDTINLTIRNTKTNEKLGEYLFSRDINAKEVDGTSLFIENVLADNEYIQVINNPETGDELPHGTDGVEVRAEGGSDGEAVQVENLVAALEPFANKVINVSILANGCSDEAEDEIFQQALLSTVDKRQDCFTFLNSRKTDEQASLSTKRAQNIVNYKKNNLASVSYYGTMYCPHCKTSDTFNTRQVKIGNAEVAVAGWLNVINTLNYPYAFAGTKNGLVTGVTYDWKIGDLSGEAELLNNASINYTAFDPSVGRYYMQCQNTLQIANSSMRNIGTVLNVLDIKEHLITYLKEFIQMPITDELRSNIMTTIESYLSPMEGNRFSAYSFQDVTTDMDSADNTLRYLLTIAPTPYAQKIYLVMNIVNQTFDFSILQSL